MIVYLASGSPRRRELMSQIGIDIKVIVSDVDESIDITDPALVVEELSNRKASDVFETLLLQEKEDFCVIGADTVVAIDNTILGKPVDTEDAFNMIKRLSGNTHAVYTGVTICALVDDQRIKKTFHEKTLVSMYEISDEQIKTYIATGEPMDKAGAYGIQGRAAAFMREIHGDYNNVVGLPTGRLFSELCKLQTCRGEIND